MSSIDENYRLMMDAKEMRRIRDDYEVLKAEYQLLRDTISWHRHKVGQAYGIGSFKAQHAANMELWKLIKVHDVVTELPEVVANTLEAEGLARPAMMEETE